MSPKASYTNNNNPPIWFRGRMDIHQRVEGEENSAWLRPRTVTGLIPLYRLSVLSAQWRNRSAVAIAGVMAITLTWNVLMLSLNGISY